MSVRLDIAFFASSLVSSYWNGAATYYRGMVKALNDLGHRITFFEPDAYERQSHRDMPDPEWASVVVYRPTLDDVHRSLSRAARADLVIKASGVGVFDEVLEREVLSLKRPGTQVIFWDVDAPATLERVRRNPQDPFRPLIPKYDLVLTYGGGLPVVERYRALGARDCVPIYNALDPATHHPVAPRPRFRSQLSFLGNRLPDREARVEEYFLKAARLFPGGDFLLAGSGWGDKELPPNVRYLGHLGTAEHNAFNCSAGAVLNICRDSMAENGFSPATRVFEAAGAGACIITDCWTGIEQFFAPGREILVADSGEAVARLLGELTRERCAAIGVNAYHRVSAQHTYAHRARQFEEILGIARDKAPALAGVAP
ncbi:hypothetical protein GMST_00710 [Geomonas silvestris]|uniref:Spore protein YkvP/CgeB glycosyl transferase-like domain-containing protein n=1 Tax=Geomonas silvestris TaxID=2740184 RepID=A0A6V8MCT5_9BACT|nr:glycosyltransferase [Geomonas silvestris]GFO57746.1 hypothetical protein GMST_00710 [Geomonas silvestris]